MPEHNDFEATWSPAAGGESLEPCDVCGTLTAVSDLKGVPRTPAGTLARAGGGPRVVDVCGDCRD